jgi:pantoate--beta-alanine ligase
MKSKPPVFSTIPTWLAWRKSLPAGKNIAFVPTMGCLHAGHGALLQEARKHNDVVVLSIYVNPTQFNEEKDLDNYPRSLEEDLQLASELGVDAVFFPSTEDMYTDGQQFSLSSDHEWANIAEGAARPGHFSGVLTVVMKLLNLVQPTCVYFGEKDYQQCRLIEAMVEAFFMSVGVVIVPTVREVSGLALSSRNSLLSSEEKKTAELFAAEFLQPDHSLATLKEALQALSLELDYLIEATGRWLVAVRVGSVRLIDNRQAGG